MDLQIHGGCWGLGWRSSCPHRDHFLFEKVWASKNQQPYVIPWYAAGMCLDTWWTQELENMVRPSVLGICSAVQRPRTGVLATRAFLPLRWLLPYILLKLAFRSYSPRFNTSAIDRLVFWPTFIFSFARWFEKYSAQIVFMSSLNQHSLWCAQGS